MGGGGGGGRGESVSLNRGYSKEDNSTNENQIVMHTHGDGGMFTMINTVRMVRAGGGWCMSVVAGGMFTMINTVRMVRAGGG